MPELKIVAVFVAKGDWMMWQYSNGTRSKPIKITTGEVFAGLALETSNNIWLTLKKALCCQDTWFTVEDLVPEI